MKTNSTMSVCTVPDIHHPPDVGMEPELCTIAGLQGREGVREGGRRKGMKERRKKGEKCKEGREVQGRERSARKGGTEQYEVSEDAGTKMSNGQLLPGTCV